MIDLAFITIIAGDKVTMADQPQIFNKAWNHPDPESQRKWQKAIQKINDKKKMSLEEDT